MHSLMRLQTKQWDHLCVCVSHLVMSECDPLGLQPARLLCSWSFSGKNTGVGCHLLLQRSFLTQGSNSCLLLCRRILYSLSHQKSPGIIYRQRQPRKNFLGKVISEAQKELNQSKKVPGRRIMMNKGPVMIEELMSKRMAEQGKPGRGWYKAELEKRQRLDCAQARQQE